MTAEKQPFSEFSAPKLLARVGAHLVFSQTDVNCFRTSRSRSLMTGILELGKDFSPERAEGLASKWGGLGLCAHNFPNHCKYEKEGEWDGVSAYFENIAGWRAWARLFLAVARAASRVNSERSVSSRRVVSPQDWRTIEKLLGLLQNEYANVSDPNDVPGVPRDRFPTVCLECEAVHAWTPRMLRYCEYCGSSLDIPEYYRNTPCVLRDGKRLARSLSELLWLFAIHPHVTWEQDSKTWMSKLGPPHTGKSQLLGVAFQELLSNIVAPAGLATCDGCLMVYGPSRAPGAGRPSADGTAKRYCPVCRKSGVPQREAARAYRSRTAKKAMQAPLLAASKRDATGS